MSRPQKTRQGVVYFVEAVGANCVKIGYTSRNDVNDRIVEWQVGCPHDLSIARLIPGTIEDERRWHRQFRHLHKRGEWFRLENGLAEMLSKPRQANHAPPQEPGPIAEAERRGDRETALRLAQEHLEKARKDAGICPPDVGSK